MIPLTARDALVPHLRRVTDEERPCIGGDLSGDLLYAVFATGDRERFLGLVSAKDVAERPHRIFADLLRERLPGVVADTLPLEAVLRCLDASERWYLPVVDEEGRFLGAVTRARILEVLLQLYCRLLEQNRALTRRTFVLQERERRHLARELHDELGQYLVALRTDLEHLRQLEKGDRGIQAQVDVIERVLESLHAAVRRIMRKLRPELLDQLGLPDTLRELVAEYRQRYPDMAFSLKLAGELKNLSDDQAITLYRVVQESLTNVVRHAGAKSVRICVCRYRRCDNPICGAYFPPFTCRPDVVHLLVYDNGKGLPPQGERRGFGLLGLRERVEALGGSFRIHSEPGKGTWIIVELPLTMDDGDDPIVVGG